MSAEYYPDPDKEQVDVIGVCDLCFTHGKHLLVELHNFKRVLICIDCFASIEIAEDAPRPKA